MLVALMATQVSRVLTSTDSGQCLHHQPLVLVRARGGLKDVEEDLFEEHLHMYER